MPATRVGDVPKCGPCHAPLFTGQPIALTSVDVALHASRADLPLVVDFWTPWCGPCRTMAPAYAEAAKILEPHVRLAKVNTEEKPALAARFGVASIPTLIGCRHDGEVARQVEAMRRPEIERWVRAHIGT